MKKGKLTFHNTGGMTLISLSMYQRLVKLVSGAATVHDPDRYIQPLQDEILRL